MVGCGDDAHAFVTEGDDADAGPAAGVGDDAQVAALGADGVIDLLGSLVLDGDGDARGKFPAGGRGAG